MERLFDFTNGNMDDLRDLIGLYLRQTGEQFQQLQRAVTTQSSAEIRRLAHSCAGASATCGMAGIVPLLRELERQGTEGEIGTSADVFAKAQVEFGRIREFLEGYLARHAVVAAPH
jgi:HPt (histidine-containing phosphotransfer) domain-containing protein